MYIRFFKNISNLFFFLNAKTNIMKTNILHKMKFDLKGHLVLLFIFRNKFFLCIVKYLILSQFSMNTKIIKKHIFIKQTLTSKVIH